MRFYVKDSERKPDPEPIKVNTKLAIIVGLVLWVAALLFLVLQATQATAQKSWYTSTCVVGIILGIYALWRERRR
jgi:cytochrome bd-type quinol oxidase subunit 1